MLTVLMHARWLRLLILCLAVPGGVVARADTNDDAERLLRAHYEVAQVHYRAGRYREAVAAFELAYREKPLPLLLYNIAQAARLGGDPDKALDYYRRYLAAVPDAPERATVEQRIHELEPQVDARARARAEAAPPVNVIVVTPAPPPRHRNRLAIALGVSAGVVVIAGVALGLGFGITRGPPSTSFGTFTPTTTK